jgi:PPOX class probable FMN-dependent enzyme
VSNEHTIRTLAEIHGLVGQPKPEISGKLVKDLGRIERQFIARSPFLLMATASAGGAVSVSPKGDAPGFVRVLDETTLVIPERPGNRLVMGYRNMLENPNIGLIFLIPGTGDTLRVQGRVELTRDPELLETLSARGKPALLAIRVSVETVFFHCAKAFLRASLWKPESWPEDFGFRWGGWVKERYGVTDDVAAGIDVEIAEDYRERL